jgi:hypothetical protein
MTWYEWCESEYNTRDNCFCILENSPIVWSISDDRICSENNFDSQVYGNELIVNGKVYYAVQAPGGSSIF